MRFITQVPAWTAGHTGTPRQPQEIARFLDLAVEVGVTDVRMSWPWVYTEEISSSFQAHIVAVLDGIATEVASRGLGLHTILAGANPCWASSMAGKNCATRTSREQAWGSPPADYATLESVATDYCDRWNFAGIEVANEPDHASEPWAMTDAETVAATQAVWNGVKASTRPNTPVLSPSLSTNDPSHLADLYTAGIGGYFDHLVLHPYGFDYTASPFTQFGPGTYLDSLLDDYAAVMAANGDGAKTIIVNEWGYTDAATHPFITAVSSAQKEAWLVEGLQIQAAHPNVGVAGFFTLHPGPALGVSSDGFGLLDRLGRKLPAFDVVTDAIAAINAP